VSENVIANTLCNKKTFSKHLDGIGRFVRKRMVAELLEPEWSETIHMYHIFNVTRYVRFYLTLHVSFYVLLTVHLVIVCNENQLDVLFIYNLFRQQTSTCFGHVYCPSSGSIHCICTANGTCYVFKLTGFWSGQDGTQNVPIAVHIPLTVNTS
jgi:hypothetical protein